MPNKSYIFCSSPSALYLAMNRVWAAPIPKSILKYEITESEIVKIP